MSAVKRLGKDQRNKFIKEFEQDGKLSDPNFYAIKDKNGKIQIRRKKAEKVDSEEKEPDQPLPGPPRPPLGGPPLPCPPRPLPGNPMFPLMFRKDKITTSFLSVL